MHWEMGRDCIVQVQADIHAAVRGLNREKRRALVGPHRAE